MFIRRQAAHPAGLRAGEHLLPADVRFDDLAALFPKYRAVRSIIRMDVHRVADSCGFGVPQMDLIGQRSRLFDWGDHESDGELQKSKREKIAQSIDGLPAYLPDG